MSENLSIIKTNDGSHSLYSNIFNEHYHSKHGSILESKHVFIHNGLRLHKGKKLNILEIGFGSGLNALLTNDYCKKNKIKVNYHSVELYPVEESIFNKLNFAQLLKIKKTDFINLHKYKWNKNYHVNNFFNFKKHNLDIKKFKSEEKFNIIYFDAFSPSKQPEMWSFKIFKQMFNILYNDGFLVTYCANGTVKRTMKKVGFKIKELDGPPGKRQMTKANK